MCYKKIKMEKYKIVRFRLKEKIWRDIIKKRAEMSIDEGRNVSFNEVINRILEEYFEKCSRKEKNKSEKDN